MKSLTFRRCVVYTTHICKSLILFNTPSKYIRYTALVEAIDIKGNLDVVVTP